MSALLKQLEEQASTLTVDERAKLAEFMLESLNPLDSEIGAAWDEEIERRVAAFDRGDVPSSAAEDVFAEARRISRSKR